MKLRKSGMISRSFDFGAQSLNQSDLTFTPPPKKKKKTLYNENGENISAIQDEIDKIYVTGINKMYEKEQLEYQKLGAIQK